jgi:hypothetical protein
MWRSISFFRAAVVAAAVEEAVTGSILWPPVLAFSILKNHHSRLSTIVFKVLRGRKTKSSHELTRI